MSNSSVVTKSLPSVNDFIKLLGAGHNVMDGDLRLNETASADGVTYSLDKVNYGGTLRRLFFANARLVPSEAENQHVRIALYKAIASELGKDFTSDDLKDLREALGICMRKDENGNSYLDEMSSSTEALSRLTAQLVIEKFTGRQLSAEIKDQIAPGEKVAKTGTNDWNAQWTTDGQGGEIKQSYFKILDGKKDDAVTWRRFGGEKGLGLSQAKFNSLFDRALEVAIKAHKPEAAGLKNLVAHYKAIFADKNASIEDLQLFFGDEREYIAGKRAAAGDNGHAVSRFDFNERNIAEKLWLAFTKNPPLPEVAGKTHDNAGVGLLPEGFKTQINAYQSRMSTFGDVDDVIMIEKKEAVQNNGDVQPKGAEKNVRNLIGDLFFNDANPMEMEKYGFSDGERLGRVLFSHQDVFVTICTEIANKSLAAKNKQANPLNDNSLSVIANKVLSQISPDLAGQFEDMIAKINSRLTFVKENDGLKLTFSECQNKAQDIFNEIKKAKFEQKIDDALVKFFTVNREGVCGGKVEDSKVYNQLVEELCITDPTCYTDEEAGLLENVLKANLTVTSGLGENHSGAGNVALRRMLSAGTRHSMSGLGPGATFDIGAMLRGGGPALIKRLQALPGELFEPGNGGVKLLKGNIEHSLDVITHKLTGSGDLVLKMQLYDVFKQLKGQDSNIKGIKVTNPQLGAASIAQAIKCKLVYDENDDANNPEVVIKLVRPDVKITFDKESTVFGKLGLMRTHGENATHDPRLEYITQRFIDDVSPEFELSRETLNAFLAIVANHKGNSLDQVFQTGKGKAAEGDINLSAVKDLDDFYSHLGQYLGRSDDRKFGTEQLIWKNTPDGNPTDGLLKQALADIEKCRRQFDLVGGGGDPKKYYDTLMDIAKKYCVMSADFIVMKEAKGVEMDNFISDIEKKISDKDVDKTVLMKDLVQAKKSMLQLGEELFNGLAKGVPPMFHGDLHGGNIFYEKESGKYTLIDYGKGSPLTNETAKAILDCFNLAAKPYDKNGDVVSQVEQRATNLIAAYKRALEEELKVWKSNNNNANIAKDNCPKPIQRLMDTIKVLEETKPFHEKLKAEIVKVIGDDIDNLNTDAGAIVDAMSKAVKADGMAQSNTLFGFFDSYSKLNKTLVKIDVLINELDPGKKVTGFEKEKFSLGQLQEECKNELEKKGEPDSKKLGEFYEKLPKFIREEADKKVMLSVADKKPILDEYSTHYENSEEPFKFEEKYSAKKLGANDLSTDYQKSKPVFDFFMNINKEMTDPSTNLTVSLKDGSEEVKEFANDVKNLVDAIGNFYKQPSNQESSKTGSKEPVNVKKEVVAKEEVTDDTPVGNGATFADWKKEIKDGKYDDELKGLIAKNNAAKQEVDKFIQLIVDDLIVMTAEERHPDVGKQVKEILKGSGGLKSFEGFFESKNTGEKSKIELLQECYKPVQLNGAKFDSLKYVDYTDSRVQDFVSELKSAYFSDAVFKDTNVMDKMNVFAEKYKYDCDKNIPRMGGERMAFEILALVKGECGRQGIENSKNIRTKEIEDYEKDYGWDDKTQKYTAFDTADKLNIGEGRGLKKLADRCSAALEEIEDLNLNIGSNYSRLGGVFRLAVDSLNVGEQNGGK